jgi:tRNA(fMet)-specific endonuclease VapC
MIRYVIDTDHISLVLRRHPQVSQRFRQEIQMLGITIISVQETFNGWAGKINLVKDEPERITAYSHLHRSASFFQTLQLLNYDQAASDTYQRLIANTPALAKKRLDKDIRIAAIALANQAIVVTRNYRDFNLIPGLQIEDWSL